MISAPLIISWKRSDSVGSASFDKPEPNNYEYVKDINEHLKKGQIVKAKVIKIDDNGKISLSIKQAMSAEEKKEKRKNEKQERVPVRPADIDWSVKDDNLSFEDKLSKFKTDSDEAFRILKRSAASKRSGGYSRKGNYSF